MYASLLFLWNRFHLSSIKSVEVLTVSVTGNAIMLHLLSVLILECHKGWRMLKYLMKTSRGCSMLMDDPWATKRMEECIICEIPEVIETA